MNKIILKKSKGFVLIEKIMVLGLIFILIGAIFLLIHRSTVLVSDIFFKHKAAYLAKEGVEIIRNIRDTNWLEEESWDQGILEGNWEVYYKTRQELTQPYLGTKLNIDAQGFYSYSPGIETKFSRRITIGRADLDGDGEKEIQIWSRVQWEKRGRIFDITVQKNLYNWN